MNKYLRLTKLVLLASGLVILASCGGGGGNSSGSTTLSPGSTALSLDSSVPSATTAKVTSVISPSTTSSFSGSTSNINLPAIAAGRDVLVMAVDANGNVLVASMTTGEATAMNSKTTAIALTRIAMGHLPTGTTASQANAAIQASEAFSALVDAIEQSLAAGTAPANSNAVITALATVVSQAINSLIPTTDSSFVKTAVFSAQNPLPYWILNSGSTTDNLGITSATVSGGVAVANGFPIIFSSASSDASGNSIGNSSLLSPARFNQTINSLGTVAATTDVPGNGSEFRLVITQDAASKAANFQLIAQDIASLYLDLSGAVDNDNCAPTAAADVIQSGSLGTSLTAAVQAPSPVAAIRALLVSGKNFGAALVKECAIHPTEDFINSVLYPIQSTYERSYKAMVSGASVLQDDKSLAWEISTFAVSYAFNFTPIEINVCEAGGAIQNCVSSLSITPSSSNLTPGDSTQLAATGFDSKGIQTVIPSNLVWSTSYAGLSVSSSGLATALISAPAGDATVTVSDPLTGVSALAIIKIATVTSGACGSANGTTVSSTPAANLCSTGTESAVNGSGPWNWICSGSNGGSDASCSASKMLTGSQIKLNDTGISSTQCLRSTSAFTDCSSAGATAFGMEQDGMGGRDADASTNSNTDGKLGFSFTNISGGCVKDNVTGLMWEAKTTDGGLHDWTNRYTNVGDNSAAEASTFVSAVNAASLCGYSDWRLPTTDELQSIVDYGTASPTVDGTWFPNTQKSPFLTGELDIGDPTNKIWCVDFIYGTIGKCMRSNTDQGRGPVRLVRAGQAAVQNRYSISADGLEVTDNKTNLIWRRCSEGMSWNGTSCTGSASAYTLQAALQQAATQASSTNAAWRLPNIKELASIVDVTVTSPTIDSAAFPATPPSRFWSSTPMITFADGTFTVVFDGGNASVDGGTAYYSYLVRLVRTGP